MGDTLWIEARGRPQAETADDCSISLRVADRLDDLAKRIGVGPFSGFFDHSEVNAAYADLIAEAGVDVPDGPGAAKWSDAQAGLQVVRALQEHLATHPGELDLDLGPGRDHWPARLAEELAHFCAVLERAVADDQPFRLLVVP
jgi:hypothetical protein